MAMNQKVFNSHGRSCLQKEILGADLGTCGSILVLCL